MKVLHGALPALVVSLQVSPVLAFWRMACSVSQTARVDPVVNPGTVSGHVHKFAGGNNVDASSTYSSLYDDSTCSTCEVQEDRSAYWTPQLYYQHGNGTFSIVPNNGMTVYYVGRGGNTSNTVIFPENFRMVSGDVRQRSYDNTTLTYLDTRPVADRVSFRCINDANDIPETHYINDTNCSNGLRAQINFQSCWDGQNLYLPDNSHVAYLSGIDYGVCPPTHPVSIPGLFYEVLYYSNAIDQTDGGRFVLSNGDTTGYSFHADFLGGWNQTVFQEALDQCLYANPDGVVSHCAPLAASDDINFPRDCLPSAPLLNEAIDGLLTALPGCNPVTSGPDPVVQQICPDDSHSGAVSSTVSTSTVSTTSSSLTSSLTTIQSSTAVTTTTTSTLQMSTVVSIASSSVMSTTTPTQSSSVPPYTSATVAASIVGDLSTSIAVTSTAMPINTFTTSPAAVVNPAVVAPEVATPDSGAAATTGGSLQWSDFFARNARRDLSRSLPITITPTQSANIGNGTLSTNKDEASSNVPSVLIAAGQNNELISPIPTSGFDDYCFSNPTVPLEQCRSSMVAALPKSALTTATQGNLMTTTSAMIMARSAGPQSFMWGPALSRVSISPSTTSITETQMIDQSTIQAIETSTYRIRGRGFYRLFQ